MYSKIVHIFNFFFKNLQNLQKTLSNKEWYITYIFINVIIDLMIRYNFTSLSFKTIKFISYIVFYSLRI